MEYSWPWEAPGHTIGPRGWPLATAPPMGEQERAEEENLVLTAGRRGTRPQWEELIRRTGKEQTHSWWWILACSLVPDRIINLFSGPKLLTY